MFHESCQPPTVWSSHGADSAPNLRPLPPGPARVAERRVDEAVGYKAVARDEGVAAEVVAGVELVVDRPAERRVAGVEAAALLVEQRVTHVEGEAAREAAVDLYLHGVRAPGAEVVVAGQECAELGEREARAVCVGDGAVVAGRARVAVLVE